MLWEVRGLRAKPRRGRWEMDTGGTAWRWGGRMGLFKYASHGRGLGLSCHVSLRAGTARRWTSAQQNCDRLFGCLPVWHLPSFLLVTEPTCCSRDSPSPTLGPCVLADDSIPSSRWSYDSGLRESAYPILSGHNDWSKNRPVTQLSSMRSTFWTSMELLVKSRPPRSWIWGCMDVSIWKWSWHKAEHGQEKGWHSALPHSSWAPRTSCAWYPLDQRSSTILALGTGFTKDNFSTDRGRRGMILTVMRAMESGRWPRGWGPLP